MTVKDHMTPEAKRKLSGTIRELRAYLLEALHAAVESEYRFAIKRAQDAGLDEARTAKRRRFETWIAEQVRADARAKKKVARTAEDFRLEAEKQAAYTLLNRLVLLRLMEAAGLRSPNVVTGGWESRGYRDFRELAQALVREDPSEGYAFLLKLVFEDLAHDLPGLYGPAGIAELVPIGPAVLRRVVEALNDPALDSCWTDDMTLGWVYQYWNDPEREALDAKLNSGGKVEPHEIAPKTQMFTERYMVDWLLQNSLGPMWLAMCKKHGWTPAAEADGTLDALEERRAEWRAKREAGEVELTALMPLHTEMEQRWAYYVPQPIPEEAVAQAPDSVRELKILDPAVGSGHFLMVAFDLLFALYREEARHRGEEGDPRWSERAIVEHILEHNLHGIDLDPRAVQIAAAALWLKAKERCPDAEPGRMNLVASNLRLGSLPDDDPALVELRREVERETGIPGELTDTIVHALRGADHLGSLLKVDRAVDEAIEAHERELGRQRSFVFVSDDPLEGRMVEGTGPDAFIMPEGRASLMERLEDFLSRYTGGDDLGLRLRGEQLAAGVRFVRMVREGAYDLVVANPPYQGTSKMADAAYVAKQYPLGKADLYAAFLLRGLELVRDGGVSSMLTMRNWMFIKQYTGLRERLLSTFDLRALGDFAIGAFDEVPNDVLSVVVSTFARRAQSSTRSVAQQPTPPDDRSYDRARTRRKRGATLCHVGRHEFDPAALQVVPEWPLVYWWARALLDDYARLPMLGDAAPCKVGIVTGNNTRFTRKHYELSAVTLEGAWVPYVTGARGMSWIDPCDERLEWRRNGLATKTLSEKIYGSHTRQVRNEELYFRTGIACTAIGNNFAARLHNRPSVVGSSAASVYPDDLKGSLCLLNSRRATSILQSLNPGVHFEVGDINRVPVFEVPDSADVFGTIRSAFEQAEAHRETSVDFSSPGPSPWEYAQSWAQLAIDRADREPLPAYDPEYDPEPATDHLSFALGVALGRFGPNGEGILDPEKDDLSHALPAGILFLDGTLDTEDRRDGLGKAGAGPLHEAWKAYGAEIDAMSDVRTWLRLRFFSDVHKGMYENRPIHWPLSSEKKTFVAWINIHRWDAQTLRVLLAEDLHQAQARLDGELTDLRAARDGADKKTARAAEKRYDKVLKWREELAEFVELVTQCAEKGAPPTDPKCPEREVDARYVPDLDDGVMINSAGLWPLLEPQWKDPKKWWKELASAKGKKDYDWSHLAMRYWPTRVDAKCQEDPSLGVAHGCFWRYHPARAWAWELRLQDEIGPDFRIEEKPYNPPGLASGPTGDQGDGPHRAAYLRGHPREALAAVEKEALRRRGRGKDAKVVPEMRILEPGLWSALPEECWDLELRLSEKQGAEFRLIAPDEPEARAAFEAAHPERVKAREHLLADLQPPRELDYGDEPEDEADDGVADDEGMDEEAVL